MKLKAEVGALVQLTATFPSMMPRPGYREWQHGQQPYIDIMTHSNTHYTPLQPDHTAAIMVPTPLFLTAAFNTDTSRMTAVVRNELSLVIIDMT
jgi:hypothetical protein